MFSLGEQTAGLLYLEVVLALLFAISISQYFHPGFRANPSREQDLTMIAVIPRTSRSIMHLAKEVLDVVSCLLLERLGNDAMLADVCTAPAPGQVVYQWPFPVRSEPRCKSKFWQCQ